ncbi:MAG: galactosyltransferase-related protein [Phycisphaerales bacterium JB039]
MRRPIHIAICTHTAERIERTLLGVRWQTTPVDSVTITCDGDSAELEAGLRAACLRAGVAATILLRAQPDVCRLGQVRNNAVRRLLEQGAGDADVLVFLDGDCVPAPEVAIGHEQRLRRGDLVLAHRFDLTAEQSAAFDEAALRAGRWPYAPTPEQIRAINRRHRRYQRQALLRRFGLTKAHKPKIIGGHFGVTIGQWRKVNGQDETYGEYGQEDDDFARRIYASGGRPVVATRELLAFHQYHPTRAPGAWRDSPNAQRLSEAFAVRCASGLESGLAQPPLRIVEVTPEAPPAP